MANLYNISFSHHARGDSQDGTYRYVIAENDNQVFDYMMSGEVPVFDWDTNRFIDSIVEDLEESAIARKGPDNEIDVNATIIKQRGDYWRALSDELSYGDTLWGWELVHKDLTLIETKTLMKTLKRDIRDLTDLAKTKQVN